MDSADERNELARLARRIADGQSVDWENECTQTGVSPDQAKHLKLVERISDAQGRWLVRAVRNKYPALRPRPEGAPDGSARGEPEGWHRLAADGHHEVIVETPDHAAPGGSATARCGWRKYQALPLSYLLVSFLECRHRRLLAGLFG